eukprot:scaffold1882_cov384-Prasinococcus_capsulatus_cf.AAC.4
MVWAHQRPDVPHAVRSLADRVHLLGVPWEELRPPCSTARVVRCPAHPTAAAPRCRRRPPSPRRARAAAPPHAVRRGRSRQSPRTSHPRCPSLRLRVLQAARRQLHSIKQASDQYQPTPRARSTLQAHPLTSSPLVRRSRDRAARRKPARGLRSRRRCLVAASRRTTPCT